MDCWYCARIRKHNPEYVTLPASFDVGSETPRCQRHWRFTCELCQRDVHFQGTGFCPTESAPFCKKCALSATQIQYDFWDWKYYWSLRCPFCGEWHPTLDFREYQGTAELPSSHVSGEAYLRPPSPQEYLPVLEDLTDEKVGKMWSDNAETWSRYCGAEGDMVRKYISDPVLFSLLGEVRGETVLDAGCGEGYLCRRLADMGATVIGIEMASALYERGAAQEKANPKGIRYLHGSISSMPEVSEKIIDAVVCNNVFMYCQDIEGALLEFGRVLKPAGRAILTFTHPCFWGPGTKWVMAPPDTPHVEDWVARRVTGYLNRIPHQFVRPDYGKPLIFFPRTLGDYFSAFSRSGFRVTHLVEPTFAPEAAGSLPPETFAVYSSWPISIVLRLVPKENEPASSTTPG